MTMARKEVLVQGGDGVYHCVSRCVRRALLCGFDPYSRRDYEHRKQWLRDRVHELSGIFAIDVAAYAVMANHVHLVLACNPARTDQWSDEEVARRWSRLFPRQRDENGIPLPPTQEHLEQLRAEPERIAELRARLGNLSWFMRCLNENIARRANREDRCKGRFWEGRFKCQRLDDQGAILACMAYVDLNPVRAGLADRPECSDFTSVFDRIGARQGREQLGRARVCESRASAEQKQMLAEARKQSQRDGWLCPIEQVLRLAGCDTAEQSLDRYLELVDWTGREIRADKPGAIPKHLEEVLERLELDVEAWVNSVERYGGLFYRVAGSSHRIAAAARRAGQQWMHGVRTSLRVYQKQPG